ncbi:MAG TPA: glycosyltransferase family 39 protein [Candidatus Saccharimonadales bacterium]|nr:glycosyltransferase family 39 protein [Candidatus Saccharimonadales bacterium]
MKHIPIVLAILLLLLMAVLAGGAVRRQSIAVDEVAHLGAGVSYLQKLDLRMNQEHPALPKILAALPLVIRGVHADYSNTSWNFSGSIFGNILGEWVWGHQVALQWNDPYSTIFWARLPMLLLTLVLGVFVYRYAAQLGGPWAGLLCLAAFVSTPAFIVFGPLVLTDVPVTLFVLLTLWKFADLWRSPTPRNATAFGLFFAAAVLSKYNAGLLFVCVLAFRLSLRWMPLPGIPAEKSELEFWRKVRARAMWKGILVATVSAYLFYLVFSWNQPSDSLKFFGQNWAALVLRRLLMPAWLYLRGVAIFAMSSPRPTFLLGHNYPHGVWFYFPVMFVLKSTLAFLLMLALTIPVAWIARRRLKPVPLIPPEKAFHWRAVWTSLIVFTVFCLISPMTISIRHFTIPILLMILLLAPVPRILSLLRERGAHGVPALAAAYALLAVISEATIYSHYPYFMPFLNHLSFGRPAYTLINDSNLDWDQALPDAERFVQQHGFKHVLLDEYGFIDPVIYLPQAESWGCQSATQADAGQWAIVSASMLLDGANCAWLLNYPHSSIAGGGMYVFHLPAVIPPAGDPLGPPPPDKRRNLGGAPMDSRAIFLKCIADPNQLQPTWNQMMANYRQEMAKRQAEREAKRKRH